MYLVQAVKVNQAMMRIANQDFPHVDIDLDDTIIFSSKIIPGNEKKIFQLFNVSELGAKC